MFDENKLDAVLEEIMTRWGIPGLGVGIVHENEIVYAKGFGVQSLETRAPVTPDSIFCTASILPSAPFSNSPRRASGIWSKSGASAA